MDIVRPKVFAVGKRVPKPFVVARGDLEADVVAAETAIGRLPERPYALDLRSGVAAARARRRWVVGVLILAGVIVVGLACAMRG